MKFLKIALIVLLPAMGIVGCKKSGTKPECSSHKSNQTENTEVSSRFGDIPDEEGNTATLVGSGDDDRNGGDKKPKKSR